MCKENSQMGVDPYHIKDMWDFKLSKYKNLWKFSIKFTNFSALACFEKVLKKTNQPTIFVYPCKQTYKKMAFL